MFLICCTKNSCKVADDTDYTKHQSPDFSQDFTSQVIDLRTVVDRKCIPPDKDCKSQTDIFTLRSKTCETSRDLRRTAGIRFSNPTNAVLNANRPCSMMHRYTMGKFGNFDYARNSQYFFEHRKKYLSPTDASHGFPSAEDFASKIKFGNESKNTLSQFTLHAENTKEPFYFRQRFLDSPGEDGMKIPLINVITSGHLPLRSDSNSSSHSEGNHLNQNENSRKPSATSESDYADLDYDEVTTSLEEEERSQADSARFNVLTKFNQDAPVTIQRFERRPLPEINEPLEVTVDNSIYSTL